MARIQLRDTQIYMKDGLAGTARTDGAALVGVTTLAVDTVVTNYSDTGIIPVGAGLSIAGSTAAYTVTARVPTGGGSPTTEVTITPPLVYSVPDNAAVTITAQSIEIKIGDGDISWKESRNIIYDLNRGLLSDVREGDDVPLEVSLAFTFEYVKTETGKDITPVDAIKRLGEASEWVSTDTDKCAPYSVNIYVIHCIKCGTDKAQDFLFKDFRYEDLDYSVKDASIDVSGKCNVRDAITTRSDFPECN